MNIGQNRINATDHNQWKTISSQAFVGNRAMDLRMPRKPRDYRGRVYRYEGGQLASVIEYQFLDEARQHFYNWTN